MNASALAFVACGEAALSDTDLFHGLNEVIVEDMIDMEEWGEKVLWPAGSNVITAKGWLESRTFLQERRGALQHDESGEEVALTLGRGQ